MSSGHCVVWYGTYDGPTVLFRSLGANEKSASPGRSGWEHPPAGRLRDTEEALLLGSRQGSSAWTHLANGEGPPLFGPDIEQ